MRKITIDVRQVVGWYNVIAKLLIDAQIPASPETMQAMGLLYASQLRVRDFELSEAVRAFKNMWTLDAACTSTVDGQIIPPHVTTASERKELRFSEPALEAQIASDEAPESDGTLAAEREKLQAATRAALGVGCPTCGAEGFTQSSLGPDRCTFCDGTESGNPPEQEEK